MPQRLPAPTADRGTLLDLLERNVLLLGDQPMASDSGNTFTWREFGVAARAMALAYYELGVRKGDFVGIHQRNRYEHIVADAAALLLGAIPVSVYNTLSPEQLEFVASDTRMRLLVVEASFLGNWDPALSRLVHLTNVIAVDGAGDRSDVLHWSQVMNRGRELLTAGDLTPLAAARDATTPESLATVIYTSGTTGTPKGVLFNHRVVRFTLNGIDGRFQEQVAIGPAGRDDPTLAGGRLLSYLPMAHAAERFASYYLTLQWGSHIHFVREIDQLAVQLPAVRPAFLMAVPRVWEKFGSAMRTKLSSGGLKAKIGTSALEVATRIGEAKMAGRKAGSALALQHAAFEKTLYPKMRRAMGLDRCALALSGAAPIDAGLLCMLNGIGISVIEGYGMTESGGLATLSSLAELKPGSVGKAYHPDVEIRIAADGEILVRGPGITPGYHNRPDATAEAIDPDGWLHTGDLGALDADGRLSVTGRKKELIINSAGKNISPDAIETAIKRESVLISHVVAMGDRRNYITALVVLDPDALGAWAATSGLPSSSFAELAHDPRIRAEVDKAVQAGNGRLSRVEQVKEFAIVEEPWVPGSPELTPTMKLRRAIIVERHRDTIESMYKATR